MHSRLLHGDRQPFWPGWEGLEARFVCFVAATVGIISGGRITLWPFGVGLNAPGAGTANAS